jgi:hypothetical protein
MSLLIDCKPLAIEDFSLLSKVKLRVADDFVSRLENSELVISKDYYSSFRRRVRPPFRIAANEYLQQDSPLWRDHSLLCPEMPLPREFTDAVQLSLPAKLAWANQAIALVHAGRSGCIAPLHFDWDQSWVAHVCLTGRKRLFFFGPESGWLLTPVINTSALCIPRFSEMDRQGLMERLDGTEIVLNAGEGILFPSLAWHGVYYEEPSISLSVRFEAQAGGRPFAALPRSWWLQRMVWHWFKNDYGNGAELFLAEYLRCFFDKNSSWKTRYRRIVALCQKALLEHGSHGGSHQFADENFWWELSLAGEEVRRCFATAAMQIRANDHVRDTVKYIFEGISMPAHGLGLQLAKYAVSLKQGLRPQRGRIKIVDL